MMLMGWRNGSKITIKLNETGAKFTQKQNFYAQIQYRNIGLDNSNGRKTPILEQESIAI